LKIAFSKCAILHIGKNNPRFVYYFANDPIKSVLHMRDLGVTISANLKFSTHINNMTKSASSTANSILRSFTHKDRRFLIRMFCTFVRPKLEYASTVWNPSTKKEINLIERVQRKFTKRLHGMFDKTYKNRLEMLGILPLELRRLHNDLIMVYKMYHGLTKLNFDNFFIRQVRVTRGHNKQLKGQRFNTALRQSFFINRVLPVWNNLAAEVVNSRSIKHFKKLLLTNDVSEYLWTHLKGEGF